VNAGREVGEEATDLVEGVLLGLGNVVDGAGDLGVDVVAAEFLLGDVQPKGGLHHRGAAGEDLADAFHHDGEMRQAGVDGGQAGDGAEHGGDGGDDVEQADVELGPLVAVGQVGSAVILEGAHGAAGGVEQADIGQAPFDGALGGGEFLAHAAALAAGAAAHGEVAGRHHRLAAVELHRSGNVGFGQEAFELAVLVGACAGQAQEFLEAGGVGDGGDAFAHQQLALLALAGDALGPTHGFGHRLAQLEFVDFLLPGHSVSFPPASCAPAFVDTWT